MRNLLKSAIIIIALATSSIANAQVFLPSAEGVQQLSKNLSYLIDESGKLTVDDVANMGQESFQKVSEIKYAGYTNIVFWTRISIDLSHYNDQFFYLRKDYQHIGSLAVYYHTPDGFSSVSVDEDLPNHGRELWARDYIFKIPAEKNIVTYYIRYEPRGHLANIELSFASQTSLINFLQLNQLWIGLFFGALGVMLFYNFAIYLYTRNKAYLYYSYYLTCFVAIFVDLNGFSSLVLHIPPKYQYIFVLCVYGTLHGVTLFARYFLNFDSTLKYLDKYLRNVKWLLLAGAIASPFMPVGIAYRTSVFAILSVIPFVLYGGIRRWHDGFAPAKIYCAGWTVFAIAIIAYSLKLLGVLSASIVTNYLVQAGAAWEAIFFSLALGYRIKLGDREVLLQKEKALIAERMAVQIAERSVAEKNTFLGMVGHELKSPLQGIISALDVLEFKVKDEGMKYVSRIRRATTALSMHLRDLLTFAQAEAGKLTIIPERFELLELSHEVVDSFVMKARSKGVNLSIETPENPIYLIADAARITQVLNNLVGNAVKYTDAGDIKVVVNPYRTSDYTFGFDIIDTGCGIPDSFINTIFDPYVRVGSIAKGREGVGIGLTIVKMIIDCLGGSIDVTSSEGIGTTFSVRIPAASTIKQVDDQKISESFHILVVDDREDVLEGVESVVVQLGFVCDKANCAAVAANFLAYRKYDLVLIDLDMPVKNGDQLASEIRRGSGPNKETRLFAFSAGANESIGCAWPFNGFLHKPVTRESIRRVVALGV